MKISRWIWIALAWLAFLVLWLLMQRAADARDCETCLRDKVTGAITRDPKAVRDFKRNVKCPSSVPKCKGYVVDHVVPLACADDIARAEGRQTADVQRELDRPANLQWQSKAEAQAKDRWERRYCLELRRNPAYTPRPRKKPTK